MFNEEEKQGSLAIYNRRVGELKGIEVQNGLLDQIDRAGVGLSSGFTLKKYSTISSSRQLGLFL